MFSFHQIAALIEAKNEPDWLREIRQDSLAKFESGSLKAKLAGDEIGLNMPENSNSDQSSKSTAAALLALRGQLKIKGIIFESLGDAAKNHRTLIKNYLNKTVGESQNEFATFNTSYWLDGTFIYVPKNVTCEFPLQAYREAGMGPLGRILIVVDENAELEFVSGCASSFQQVAGLQAGVIEMIANRDARVRFTEIKNWREEVVDATSYYFRVADGASLSWISIDLGKAKRLSQAEIELAEATSTSEVEHLYCNRDIKDSVDWIRCVGKGRSDMEVISTALEGKVAVWSSENKADQNEVDIRELKNKIKSLVEKLPMEYAVEVNRHLIDDGVLD